MQFVHPLLGKTANVFVEETQICWLFFRGLAKWLFVVVYCEKTNDMSKKRKICNKSFSIVKSSLAFKEHPYFFRSDAHEHIKQKSEKYRRLKK